MSSPKVDDLALHRAINKWESEVPIEILLDSRALKKHMREQNGIELGSWLENQDPKIVDEKKYLMFLLKFSDDL